MKNPFHKEKKFWEKAAIFLHLKKESPREKIVQALVQILLYLSIFLAGYLAAQLRNLLKLA